MTATERAGLERTLDMARRDPLAPTLPAASAFTWGDRVIAAGTTVTGPVAVSGGTLEIHGTIVGDAVSVGGNVVVRPGARVTGNAFAVLGTVRAEPGTVDGERRALRGGLGPVAAAATLGPRERTVRALGLVAGWFAVLLALGLGTLVFAGGYLEAVVAVVETRFARSFGAGFAAQLAFLPVIVLVSVALALTIIGILLIPFAVAALVLLAAGITALGFVAIAQVVGRAAAGPPRGLQNERSAHLQALVVGVTLLMVPWLLAAALAWTAVPSAIIAAIAAIVSWVAATVGLGAAVLSRAGSRPLPMSRFAEQAPALDVGWQTPTPVTGVASARRPTPAPQSARGVR